MRPFDRWIHDKKFKSELSKFILILSIPWKLFCKIQSNIPNPLNLSQQNEIIYDRSTVVIIWVAWSTGSQNKFFFESTHLKIIPVYTNTFWSRNILDNNWRKRLYYTPEILLRSQLKKFHFRMSFSAYPLYIKFLYKIMLNNNYAGSASKSNQNKRAGGRNGGTHGIEFVDFLQIWKLNFWKV